MIPAAPRRTVSTPAPPQSWADFDDDDGWQGGLLLRRIVSLVLNSRHASSPLRQDRYGPG